MEEMRQNLEGGHNPGLLGLEPIKFFNQVKDLKEGEVFVVVAFLMSRIQCVLPLSPQAFNLTVMWYCVDWCSGGMHGDLI